MSAMTAASTDGDYVDDLSRISPELVLVDPELSGRVRPRLPLSFRRRRPPLPVLHLVVDAVDDAPAHPGAADAVA
jgi:hypothetical protein